MSPTILVYASSSQLSGTGSFCTGGGATGPRLGVVARMTEDGVVDRGGVFEDVLTGGVSDLDKREVQRLGVAIGAEIFGAGGDGVSCARERKSPSLPRPEEFAGLLDTGADVAAIDNKGLGTRLSILRTSWTLLCGS